MRFFFHGVMYQEVSQVLYGGLMFHGLTRHHGLTARMPCPAKITLPEKRMILQGTGTGGGRGFGFYFLSQVLCINEIRAQKWKWVG